MKYEIVCCNKCGNKPQERFAKFCSDCGEKIGVRDANIFISVEVEQFGVEMLTLEQFFEIARKQGYLK